MLVKFAEVAGWWAALVLVWLATLNSFSYAELGTCAVIAVPGALAARAGRVAAGQRWRVRARWVRWLRFVPVAVLHDTMGVFRLATRRDRPQDDSFDEVRLRAGGAAHEALATAAVSATPGSVVVDADNERLVVHRVPIGETRLSEAVRR